MTKDKHGDKMILYFMEVEIVMSFAFYFAEQLHMHPSMQYSDAVKLCYQAAFGTEHLLSDLDRAKAYLKAELDSISPTDEPLIERISEQMCRVNLGAWKREGLSISVLFDLFKSSVATKDGAEGIFLSYLSDAEEIMSREIPSFSIEEWHAFLDEYKAAGMPPIHHSAEYREREKPHYRVVLFKRMEEIL